MPATALSSSRSTGQAHPTPLLLQRLGWQEPACGGAAADMIPGRLCCWHCTQRSAEVHTANTYRSPLRLSDQPPAPADAPGCCCRAAELAMQSLNGRLLYGQEVRQAQTLWLFMLGLLCSGLLTP